MGRGLSSGDRADHDEWFFSGNDGFGQGSVRRVVGEVFFAGKKAQKRPSLQSYMITNRAPQHWVLRFESIEHRSLRDRSGNIESYLAPDVGEIAKMRWQNDANHSSTIFAPPGNFVIADSRRPARRTIISQQPILHA